MFQLKMFQLFLLLFVCCADNVFAKQNPNTCTNYLSYPSLALGGLIKDNDCYNEPAVFQNSYALLELLDYKWENHTFTTDDGYILTLIRVVPKSGGDKDRQPVYLQHGVFMNSEGFVYPLNTSLAYVLTEQGYDVWLGDMRSTPYARKHVNLTDNDYAFWDYCLDDMAANDIRGSLAKIAEVTKKKGQIIYIGHSMGTTLSFMYASSFPEDNFLRGLVSLSPVVYWKQNNLITQGLRLVPPLGEILQALRINVLFKDINLVHQLLYRLCILVPRFCIFTFIDTGLGPSELFIPPFVTNYFTHWPDANSVRQLVQFAQMAPTNRFQKYDYGSKKNMKKYGQKNPPTYDLSKIKIPVYMFYGKNDVLVKKEGVEKLNNELGTDPSEKDFQLVPINNTNPADQFGHIQMFYANKIETLLYPDLLQYLKKLAPHN